MGAEKTDLEYAEAHKYRLLSGDLAPSVTSITRIIDDGGKAMGFAYAASKLGPDFKQIWDEKADRGTRIHAHCQAWLEGEWVEAKPDEQIYLDALEAFFHDYDPDPIEIERVVLSERGYGGRFDFIALIGGVCTLVDVKTGRPYPLEHTLQLAAYRFADGMAKYSGDKLIAVEPMPPIFKCACLYLKEDGTYQFIEYPAHRRAFAMFLELLTVHRDLKDLKKELPRVPPT